MGDIQITCDKCGNRITVSVYANADTLTCANCGAKLAVAPPAEMEPVRARLKLAHQPPPEAEKSLFQPPTADRPRSHRSRRSRPFGYRATSRWSRWSCWALFLLLAGGLAYLRYRYWPHLADGGPGALKFVTQDLIIKVALGALLFFHVVVVLYAFTEDVFTGVLCLIIPGYSLYYLLIVSDAYYIRAVVAALLIAFGLDTWSFIKYHSADTYAKVSGWIQQTEASTTAKAYPR